ncbi:MAG: sigma-54 dependent transcriptional regulator [Bdellovibrionales bacterium]|nr:sigma-54 dependent transcriptional regulator [Bdellovibrionales bacterium]
MSNLNQRHFDHTYRVSVLIVDDEEVAQLSTASVCRELFSEHADQMNLRCVSNLEDAFALLSNETFHLVLLDKDLGIDDNGNRIDGVANISDILAIQPNCQIVMLTSHDDVRAAVEAMRKGAVDYILKRSDPDYDAYRAQKLRRFLNHAHLLVKKQRMELQTREKPDEFVCKSPAMQRLRVQLENLAEVAKPVLFLGPSGLGKGAAAKKLRELRAAHLGQPDRPFLNINIAAIEPNLIASELFGHEANSFTGAGRVPKQGIFEIGNGGDIFLDEIGEASLDLQAKLLKVVEEREFQRVGSTRAIKTEARVIFATNRNLEEMVSAGLFREDLYARISAYTIRMPSLSERKQDIPEIVQVFTNRICRERGIAPISATIFPGDFLEYLASGEVPHNLRGVENTIERLLTYSKDRRTGHYHFENWQNVLGINVGKKRSVFLAGTLTLESFLKMETDLLGTPGANVKSLKGLFERKLFEEAERKFPSLTKRSEMLNIRKPHVSRKYKELKSQPAANLRKALEKESP